MRIHALSLAPLPAALKERLERLGELRYYDAAMGDPDTAEKAREAEVLLISPRGGVGIVEALESCRLISVQGTGVDAFNLEAARQKGIAVTNVPEFCTNAVAEQAFALLLAAAKRIEDGRPTLRQGRWKTALAYPTLGLAGATLGLFGYGRIGKRIAEIGRAFGMKIIACVRDPSRRRDVETADFDGLLARSDFMILAAPATEETVGCFNREAFKRMKPTAVAVNISRGSLVDEAALLEALDAGELAAAATDVFRLEPPEPDDPLLRHPRLVVSPHVAWGTADALERLLEESVVNVEAFLAGTPRNLVLGGSPS